MKIRKLGWMFLGVTSLACSGQYEVGGMDATAGTGSNQGTAGSATSGGSGTAPTAGSAPMLPVDDGTPVGIDADCLTADATSPLTGPFATPAVVWQRVATLIGGEDATPPELPEETTYEWAGSLVPIAISQLDPGNAVGIDAFLREWLRLEPEATLETPWGALLPASRPALQVLLETTWVPNRTGIFTEPSWLSQYDSISKRGANMEGSLFGAVPPSPPAGIQNPDPNPTVSERQAIEIAVANPACASCHRLFDPSGYALGHFAADGSYRELDRGPIDTTGSRLVGSGSAVEFDGIADYGQKFANTCAATFGFSDAFLRAALVLNEAPQAAREDLLQGSRERVQQAFVNGGRSYAALVAAYIQSPAGLRP